MAIAEPGLLVDHTFRKRAPSSPTQAGVMDLYGFTVGGGAVTNPGRYLVLVPPTLVDAGSTYALTDIAQSGPLS